MPEAQTMAEKLWTIPNALSLYRLAAAPAIALCLVLGRERWFVALFTISLLTDVADGWIARRFNLHTKIGARLVRLEAAEHDRLVALVSHLPQVLSTALASLIADSPEAARVAGPAAADMTRLALSPYEIWRDIFSTNAGEIDRVIGDAIARLHSLRENLLSEPDMQAMFARASRAASQLRQS